MKLSILMRKHQYKLRVTNKRDTNRLKLAKEHIRGIKRQMKSLNEKIDSLEQELNLLKEEK